MKRAHLITILYFLSTATAAYCQTIQFLPPIPYYSTNPYKATMWKGLQLTNPTVINDFADADELQLAAFAYMHPQSPYYKQAATYTRLITLLDSTLTNWYNNNQLADITNAFQGCFAYDMLKTLDSTLIPANRKAIWEKGIRKQIDSCFNSSRTVFINHYVRDVWLNGHQRLALAMFFGGNALRDSVFQEYGRYATEELFTQCLLADGATHYLSYHNEAATYHPIVVKCFLDYWLATQSTKVYALLKGLEHFAPLNQFTYKTSNGFSEYSTGPSNKCYYNGLGQTYPAAVSAYISNDGYNYTIGKAVQALELGFIYKPNMVSKPIPDSFMLYDANTLGPRGRYGNWGLVGTTRDPSSPLPEHPSEVGLPLTTVCEGKATFVGAFIMDTLASNWKNNFPLNAAFHAAAPGVKIRTGSETEWGRGFANSWLTVNEHNGITKGKSIFGISTRYNLNKAGGRMSTSPWDGMQQWVVTQDRIIGMMEIQALQKQSVYGLKTRVLLVSGRNGVCGTRKTLNVVDKYTYEYGMLKTKIHSENYNGIVDTQYVNIITFTPNDDYSAEIELHDKLDSAKDVLLTYPAGTKRYALVEVTNTSKNYSIAAPYNLKDTGLAAFQFQEQLGRKIRMVHNITTKTIAYTDTMFCPYAKASVLRSWDNALVNLSIKANGSVAFSDSIPPYGHILVINSGIDSDHIAGFNTYTTIFKPTLPLPINLLAFYAANEGKECRLKWEIAPETNTAHFILQHSSNGTTFTEIATINALDNGINNYSYLDNTPTNGKNYYRLQCVGKDGSSTYSKIISVNLGNTPPISIIPNPASNFTTICFNQTVDKATIAVYDITGKTIIQTAFIRNTNSYKLSTQSLKSGVYVLKVNTSIGSTTEKLIIHN